ncbi:MAG: serine/threonine protein kinase [Deltaproteobacteria bacterium]|nr:serine/threonine protein kinase [Deltaproteobacteria bacterium]
MSDTRTEVDPERSGSGPVLSLEAARVLARVKAGLFARHDDVTVDRFVLLRRLGAGGMGEVLLAYDPELDRKVAIKLMHRELGEANGDAGLLREARAAARLQHPNVVTIFDVGRAGDRLFVAMEYVEGRTLRAWLREQPRGRSEILLAFEQAGRGLVAAHDAGLVHRDFKPDNVLVGADGRVRVADFGIASLVASSDPSGSRTATAAVVGTPRYMAPEQYEGAEVDPRADQFAFCVSLWEALVGAAPFVAASAAELAAKLADGELASPPRSLPRPLARALVRGLSVDPQRRFADMRELLDALAHVRTAPRRRAAVLGIAGAVVLGGLAARQLAPARTDCTDPELPPLFASEAGWAQRLAREGDSEANARAAMAALQVFEERWRESAQRACEATHVRGERSTAILDARMACLTRLHRRARVLVDMLATVDHAGAWRAIDAAVELPPPAHCLDLEGEAAADAPCTIELDARVDEATTLRELGRAAEALEAARTAVVIARECSPSTRLAEARTLAASLAADTQIADADDELRRAATGAIADDAPVAMAQAAARLAALEGAERGRPAEARAWIEIADAAAQRTGDDILVTDVMVAKARLELEAGALEDASALADGAWSRRRREFGDEHPQVARVLSLRAWVEQYRRRWDEAAALHAEAAAILGRWYPPDHPVFAANLGALAVIAAARGDVAAAEGGHRRAIALLERARGPSHRDVGVPLTNLANLLAQTGRPEEAIVLADRIEAIAGTDHSARLLDAAVVVRGVALAESGRLADAEVAWRRVLELRAVAYGPDDPATALAHHSLCRVLTMEAQFDGALEHCRRAIAIEEFTFGASHPSLVDGLELLAEAAHGAERLPEAIAALERAAALGDDADTVAALRARAEQWRRDPPGAGP